ncbi:MAG: Rieske 2Fe-2S domain-containing protein [Bacteroidales bacterium]
MKSKNIFIIIYVLTCILSSCNKDHNPVPQTSLNNVLIYNIEDDPEYSDVRNLYGSVYYDRNNICDGYNCNGIIIFRAKIEDAHDDFKVFDRTCTHEAGNCALNIDSEYSEKLVCPCCGSVFNMIGEYMEKGPAKYPLQQFDCNYSDGNLRIY